MIGHSSTTAGTTTDDNIGTATSSVIVYDLYVDDFYTSVTAIIEEVKNIIIAVKVENYIERILKLAKWYIIYTFNCFRIRAPC